ncbi:hypothetical protein ACIPRI_15885 [Variovorax sp. LARHSF232]
MVCRLSLDLEAIHHDLYSWGNHMDASQLPERLEVEDWQVLVYLSWDWPERRYAGRAELFQAGTLKCRIALRGEFEVADEATDALRRKSKAFIDDWRRREHLSDSEFSEL